MMKIAWKNESGQVLVMVALSATVLIGFMAFATDVGVLLHERRTAQSVADSAAIAGATESLYEGTPTTVTPGVWAAASDDAKLNGFTPGASNGTASSSGGTLTIAISPNVSVSGYNTSGYVQAIVTQNTPTFFMNLFGFNSMNVTATAIASNTITSDGCVYVQNDGGYAVDNNAVNMNGHSLIAATNCGVTVNGNINAGGDSTINAKFVAASGTVPSGTNWSYGVPPQSDPMPKLQYDVPTLNADGTSCTAPAGSNMGCIYDFNGGTLSGNLVPGMVYYFDSKVSAVTIAKLSQVIATGDTIYLDGNMPLDFYNNGGLNMTPPGYGSSCVDSPNPLCGVLIDAPLDGSNGAGTYSCSSGLGNNGGNPGEIYFDFGNSTTTLYGIIYAPYMQMFVQDQGSSTTLYNDLIVGNICAQSGPITVNGYSGGRSPLTRVGLVY